MNIKTFNSVAELMRWIRDFSTFYMGDPIGIEGEIRRAGINRRKVLDIEISEKVNTFKKNSYAYHVSVQLERPNLVLKKLYLDFPEEMEGKKYYIEGFLKFRVTQNKYVIDAYDIQPSGKGSIELKREKILKKFSEMNLLPIEKINNIKELNEPIFNIAVCGSPNTRGLNDFINNLKRSTITPNIYFYPITVEGSKASETIIDAIQSINMRKEAQIICIVRGGGAQSSFLYLEDEKCALNIIESKIPVFTGIGHTEDTCLLDIVSKKEFNTPSVLGYEISVVNNEYIDEYNSLKKNFLKTFTSFIREVDTVYSEILKIQKTKEINYLLDVYSREIDYYFSSLNNSLLATTYNLNIFSSFEKTNNLLINQFDRSYYKLKIFLNNFDEYNSLIIEKRKELDDYSIKIERIIKEIIKNNLKDLINLEKITNYLVKSLFPKKNLGYLYDVNNNSIENLDKIKINDKIKIITKGFFFEAKITGKQKK